MNQPTAPITEFNNLTDARSFVKAHPGMYLCAGITLPYRAVPAPVDSTHRVIDLRRKYNIKFEERPYLPKDNVWWAYDLETFDPDPESRMCLIGMGATTGEALADLLDLIADAAVADNLPPTGPDHVREMISCPRESPPEFGKSRAELRDEEDGRDE